MSELRGYLAQDDRLLATASVQYRRMIEQMHAVLSSRIEKDDIQLASWKRESERFATLTDYNWNCNRTQPNLFPLCMGVRYDLKEPERQLRHNMRKPKKPIAHDLKHVTLEDDNKVCFDLGDERKLKAAPASVWIIQNPASRPQFELANIRGRLWPLYSRKEHGDFLHAWLWCCAHGAENRRPCIYFLVVLFDALKHRKERTTATWHERERAAFTELHHLFLDTFAVPLFDLDVDEALDTYRHSMQVHQSSMR